MTFLGGCILNEEIAKLRGTVPDGGDGGSGGIGGGGSGSSSGGMGGGSGGTSGIGGGSGGMSGMNGGSGGGAVIHEWHVGPSMNEARYNHTMTRLADGRILITGGVRGQFTTSTVASTEIWDPATQSFTMAAPMKTPRESHTATLLADGRVLVTGGSGPDGSTSEASTEVYDPGKNMWTTGPDMAAARVEHAAVKLPNGNVLVASGGWGNSYHTSEVYDSALGTFTATSFFSSDIFAGTFTLLPDGQVLLVGFYDSGITPDVSTALYTYSTNTWSTTGDMHPSQSARTATWMSSIGKVVFAGGYPGDSHTMSTLVETYDPVAKTWALGTPLSVARSLHTATPIELDGIPDIVWVGGYSATYSVADTCDTWSGQACSALNVPRFYHRALAVSVDGQERVMVTGGVIGENGGGYDPTNSVEVLY